MTIMEYAKKAYKEMKEKPPKERWAYFWDYYKWHAIIAVAVVAVLIQGIVTLCNHRDTAFSGVLLNTSAISDSSSFLDDFSAYAQIDTGKEKVLFSTKLYLNGENNQSNADTFQRIMAEIAIKELDFITAPPVAFQRCAYTTSRLFADLREFLDADTLARFSDRLYYIDGAVLAQMQAELGDNISYDSITIPDPRKPEAMEDPIPVGIDITDRQSFRETYYFPDSVIYFGVITNTQRPEMVMTLLDYLFTE